MLLFVSTRSLFRFVRLPRVAAASRMFRLVFEDLGLISLALYRVPVRYLRECVAVWPLRVIPFALCLLVLREYVSMMHSYGRLFFLFFSLCEICAPARLFRSEGSLYLGSIPLALRPLA